MSSPHPLRDFDNAVLATAVVVIVIAGFLTRCT